MLPLFQLQIQITNIHHPPTTNITTKPTILTIIRQEEATRVQTTAATPCTRLIRYRLAEDTLRPPTRTTTQPQTP